MSKSKKPAKLHPFRGDMKTVEEIASVLGLTKRAVYLRLQRGIPVEENMKRGPLPGSKMPCRRKPRSRSGNKQLRLQKAKPLSLKQAKLLPVKHPPFQIVRELPRNINRRTDLSTLFSHG